MAAMWLRGRVGREVEREQPCEALLVVPRAIDLGAREGLADLERATLAAEDHLLLLPPISDMHHRAQVDRCLRAALEQQRQHG